jgi:cyclopropane fatty-acyl-phospholipid synthase-like methyltransferase
VSFLRRLSFSLWYFGRPPWDSGISPPELFDFLRTHPAGRAIDLGCGTGTNVITLAQHGWQVTGVDFVPRAIARAHRKVRSAKLQADLRVDDVTQLKDISGPFDFALDLGCFHSLSGQGRDLYLARLYDLLAPGGFWLMYGFFKPSPEQAGPGLSSTDVERITTRLRLVQRQDGFDKHERPSAYLLFQKM